MIELSTNSKFYIQYNSWHAENEIAIVRKKDKYMDALIAAINAGTNLEASYHFVGVEPILGVFNGEKPVFGLAHHFGHPLSYNSFQCPFAEDKI